MLVLCWNIVVTMGMVGGSTVPHEDHGAVLREKGEQVGLQYIINITGSLEVSPDDDKLCMQMPTDATPAHTALQGSQ